MLHIHHSHFASVCGSFIDTPLYYVRCDIQQIRTNINSRIHSQSYQRNRSIASIQLWFSIEITNEMMD